MKTRTILVVAVLALIGAAAFAASVMSESPLGTAGAGKAEVSIGDLTADAIRSAAGADIAFVSASELKERDVQIPRGEVSTEDVIPFIAYTDDPIVRMNLKGSQIKQALERSVTIYPQKNLGFLQVSGLRFTFAPDGRPGSRVTSVLVGDRGNRQLSDNETYSVGMTSSMANGALGYWKIWSKNDIANSTETTIPQAIDQFFTAKKTIDYSNLNRITAAGG